MSSVLKAAVAFRSSRERTTTLVGVSTNLVLVRLALTVISCPGTAGLRTISTPSYPGRHSTIRVSNPLAETSTCAVSLGAGEKANSPLSFVAWVAFGSLRSTTFAKTTAAPV